MGKYALILSSCYLALSEHFQSKAKLQLLSLRKLIMAEKEMDGCEVAHTDPPDTNSQY